MLTTTTTKETPAKINTSVSADELQIKRDCDYLRKEFPTTGTVKLDVKPLWYGHYRLNYWDSRDVEGGFGRDNFIAKSQFVRVRHSTDGLSHEDLTHSK